MRANTSPGKNTFEDTTPHRPGLADFNGNAKENDDVESPDPQKDPNAEEWSTICALLIAIGGLVPILRFYVASNALSDWRSIRGDAVVGDFTFNRASAGVYTISWLAAKYPTASGEPVGVLSSKPGASNKGMILVGTTTVGGNPGISILTFDASGSAADRDFQVSAF